MYILYHFLYRIVLRLYHYVIVVMCYSYYYDFDTNIMLLKY